VLTGREDIVLSHEAMKPDTEGVQASVRLHFIPPALQNAASDRTARSSGLL
jgi:hypothetical protein